TGRDPGATRRDPARRRAGGCHRDRSRYALGGRSRRSQIALQEHAVRRSPLYRPRGAHHCRRTDGVRACLTCEIMRGASVRHSDAAIGDAAMGLEAFLPVAFVIGYLLGSIPFGLILTKLACTQDLRSIGSGSIGATNVLRTGRKGLAAATLLFDALKGTAAGVIACYIAGPNAAILAGFGAFLGHLFP